jgi:xanthine dehydrogenase accessory factor
MKKEVIQNVRKTLEAKQPAELSFKTDGREYVRRWSPKERLILLGGGHVALPLCTIGAMLNFRVVVVDDRPSFANRLRFPEAEQVICDPFEKAVDELEINKEDYVCVITRGHRYDAECLRKILGQKDRFPHYLGMIGSRRRVKGLKELLLEEGYAQEELDKINAPIGLPIHAETTTEIAISIAAQLVEYRRGEYAHTGFLAQQNIEETVLKALGEEEGWVMALILETKGSTPAKDGAIMAINALGQTRGTIGGGCAEGEVIQIARKMTGTKERKVVTVDMTNDIAGEEGMVCGGWMRVLIEDME